MAAGDCRGGRFPIAVSQAFPTTSDTAELTEKPIRKSCDGGRTQSDMPSEKIKIAIDRGGTFTDCIGSYKGKEEIVKLLSVDPNNYDDAPLEGIRRLLEKFTGQKINRKEKLDTSLIG